MSGLARTLCFAFAGVFLILFVPNSYAQQDEITVKEWKVPTPNSAPHDIVVDKNGTVWYTAIGVNKIGMFDPVKEQFREFDIPTQSSRPHGLVADDSGNIWFTESGAAKIGKLNPATGEIVEFPTPTLASVPHTPIMGDGVLWFTEQGASKIGKLDISTGEIEEFLTPTPRSSPYGIILDANGNPWYAALGGHRIGMVDAETGKITEYTTPTPNSGTRRIAIDSEGKLWFTEYNAAKIGSFDPKTGEFKEYDTVSQSSGPYAIWVDIYDNVWFSMTGVHKMGRFDQATGTLHEYDMPTPRTTSRFIYADSEGKVWFPNDVNDKIGVITLKSSGLESPGENLTTRDFQKNPVTLSYDITHRDEQDEAHTIIELTLTDDNRDELVKSAAYVLEMTKVGDDSPLMTEVFYAENGVLTLDITHSEPSQIFGVKEESLNAWMSGPETETISADLPLEQDSTYLLHIEILATDDIRNLYPAAPPSMDLYLDSDSPAAGQVRIVPEFPHNLVLFVSVTIGIVIFLSRRLAHTMLRGS